ncbi:MAG: class I SAM-dependent methyltransferase [Alphaproteobacteria bacterium]|nr:class I SAM-dependent methyltransferase [Alphaproteobacteria bacterium]
MSLEDSLKEHIRSHGSLSISDFMTRVLYDSQEGYYARKIPIGREGDYITAPEMTQAFGEVIALWLIDIWQQAGSPTPFHLIEMGPGRGTMMADILRTFKAMKVPISEMSIHLIEVSPLLKEVQNVTLSSFSTKVYWHETLDTLSKDQNYSLIVANEFWDALPIQQYAQTEEGWVERQIGLNGEEFVFVPEHSKIIRETCPALSELPPKIAEYLKVQNGAALFLDYGYDEADATGDTLQAIFHHKKCSPLEKIGFADLTHHVDFFYLRKLFEENQLIVHGPIDQGTFLKAIGLEIRTQMLVERATPHQKSALQTAYMRLTHPREMGTLFKVLSLTSDPSLHPFGF